METANFVSFMTASAGISTEDASLIASQFETFSKKKGDLLLEKDKVSDDYYFLEKGLMRSYLFDLEGNEVTTDFFTENDVAFEVTSFFSRTPSEAYFEAVTDCRGFVIHYQQLNHLFHTQPAFRELGRALLVKAFIASKKRNYAMINQSAEQRYQNLLRQRPQILQQAPLKHIASYLGITDSTLSRIRAR